MEKYINFGGDPNVSAFDILNDAIRVELSNGDIFLYTSRGAGEHNIQQMKSIAINGGKLNRYIARYVMGKHDMKVRNFHKE